MVRPSTAIALPLGAPLVTGGMARYRRLTPRAPYGLESGLFTVLTPPASMLASSDDPEAPRAFTDAHRELIARRLPLVAIAWLGVGVLMRSGLLLQSAVGLRTAIISLTLQAVVFVIAILLCRADPRSPRVIPVTLAACALLSLLSAGFFARIGGVEEGLTFALLTLGIGSSLAFAWGWRPALAHLAASVVAGLVAAPYLGFFATRTERVLEVAIGSCVWLGVAELSARSFRSGWYQERARRAAAETLAASLAAYRDLAENARDFIYTHDLEGRFTYVNEAFARYVGVPAADLLGRYGPDMAPHDPSNPDLRAIIARVTSGEAVPPLLFWVAAPDGTRHCLECLVSGIRGADGAVAGVRGIARDVTARTRAEDALRASEERLRRLARHQATIREDERKRLGFDLHDDVCQELVGIGILVESLRRQLAADSPAADAGLARIGSYVNEVGEHLRQLARDLRPLLLRDLGLEESLHSLAEGMTAAGTNVDAVFPTAIPRLREETEIGVYRIAQEALANAARHSGAGTIRLTLSADGRATHPRDQRRRLRLRGRRATRQRHARPRRYGGARPRARRPPRATLDPQPRYRGPARVPARGPRAGERGVAVDEGATVAVEGDRMPDPRQRPDLGELVRPVIEAQPPELRPRLVALLERAAAARYRGWAAESNADIARRLLECAAREEDIAGRVERLFPTPLPDSSDLRTALAKLGTAADSAYAGSMRDQWTVHAAAERRGATLWRDLAKDQTDSARRSELHACADLEEASAVTLETLLRSP